MVTLYKGGDHGTQDPNRNLTAWLRRTCSGFAHTDEEVLEMGSTPEMTALRQALRLVSEVASNQGWAEMNDASGDLETAMRALLKVTRIRRHDSV